MTESKHWTQTYHLFPSVLMVVGILFFVFSYMLQYQLFNYVGGLFIVFGMIVTLIQERGGKKA